MMNSATKSKLKNPWVIFVVIALAFLSIYAIKELCHEQKKQAYANRLCDVIFTIATEEYKLEDVEIELANTYQ